MPSALRLSSLAFLSVSAALCGFSVPAVAQTVHFGQPYQEGDSSAAAGPHKTPRSGGEHYHAQGHRPPPPGYQEAPSTEFQNGPDPDHEAQVKSHRDNVTGSNLGAFGSAYQDSSPAQSGQLGDATGNGWVAPRGNGF